MDNNGYWLFASLLVFGDARARIPESSGVVRTCGNVRKKKSFWFLAVAKANRHKQMICILWLSNGPIPFQASGPGRKILGLHASISPSSASLQITCPVVGPHRRGGPVVRSFTSRPAPPVAAAALCVCVCQWQVGKEAPDANARLPEVSAGTSPPPALWLGVGDSCEELAGICCPSVYCNSWSLYTF